MTDSDPKPPFKHMLIDAKTPAENQRRFIERVTAAEVVYYLTSEHGTALRLEDQFQVHSISLFDFLYRWLPGMTGDGVLAGVNWNGDLCGDGVDPFELRNEIEEYMSSRLREEYEEDHNRMTGEA